MQSKKQIIRINHTVQFIKFDVQEVLLFCSCTEPNQCVQCDLNILEKIKANTNRLALFV